MDDCFSQEWGLLPGLEGVKAISGAQRSVIALSHAPFVDVPPAGTNLPTDGRLVLSVQARSSTPLSYQWEHEGDEILAASGQHVLAQLADGSLLSWGDPASPILAELPVVPPRVRTLAAHWDHAIALLGDGTAVAWGSSGHGGTTVPPGLTNVVEVADGTALGWGYNAYGQAEVPGLRGLVAVAGTFERSAGIHGNGTLSEWGLYGGERPQLLQLVKLVGNGGGAATLSIRGDATWTPLETVQPSGSVVLLRSRDNLPSPTASTGWSSPGTDRRRRCRRRCRSRWTLGSLCQVLHCSCMDARCAWPATGLISGLETTVRPTTFAPCAIADPSP